MSYFDANIELQAKDEDLITAFKKLKDFRDVCDILEVTPTHLHYILYKKGTSKLYRHFNIPKRGGGTRQILAPCDSLIILQQKLNYIMSLIYKPKFAVHGYVKGRSIVSNAKQHLNKNYVLNFDIEDFFPSINFGRVRGVLKSFFKMGEDAATVIANICCYNNSLPQGAPTSPILSNMICFQLDKEMQLIAKQNSCVYTRYADDLTFSTTKKHFPKAIAYRGDHCVHLGQRILTIIQDNGFKVNHSKTRLHSNYQHLGVTGITVNEKLNVKRDYIKRIRAILRCLEINSLDEAQKIFEKKYIRRHTKEGNFPNIMNVVRGMINYIRLVKGPDDSIFEKLARRYNKIAKAEVFNVGIKHSRFWTSYVCVVEVGFKDEDDFYPEDQGTGFFLQGIGFITNAHVVKKFNGNDFNAIYINKSRYDQTKIAASILEIDEDRDLAILKIEGFESNIGFSYSTDYYGGQPITLLGYPNHGGSDSLYTENGEIKQYRPHYMPNKYNEETGKLGVHQERIVISPRIVTGNSGGPVVNTENQVIGVATKGFKEISPGSKDDLTADSIIVKIEDVLALYAEMHTDETPTVNQ
ncbi:reverse transcriptase domain-containing protein [Priestia megaterium]|uniref:reverse transcriptase domain-containing protein n=1 Tax=Priestia megaterium TaxID=1404 RepID=UPI0025B11375|nr:reverse transcriptase domain-containing protein [Priestia megaterium]MDN3233421.1 reverse transcriptase domain-containing protein [Priestia megaterium]